MRQVAAALFSVVLVVGCQQAPAPASAPSPRPATPGEPAVLSGIVQDLESYERLSGAALQLSLVGRRNDPIAATVTDQHGNFAFSVVHLGVYELRIGRQGYNEVSMRVEAKADNQRPVDVRMRKLGLAARCVPSRYHTVECP